MCLALIGAFALDRGNKISESPVQHEPSPTSRLTTSAEVNVGRWWVDVQTQFAVLMRIGVRFEPLPVVTFFTKTLRAFRLAGYCCHEVPHLNSRAPIV